MTDRREVAERLFPEKPAKRQTYLDHVKPQDVGNLTVPWVPSHKLRPPDETPWKVHGLIPTASVVMLCAREGVYKTFLSLNIAFAVAQGKPFLNRETETGAVLYIDAENPPDLLPLRLRSIGSSENLHVWCWWHDPPPLALNGPFMELASKEFNLIVIDTLKRFMEGRDENSSADMAEITGQLRALTKHGASVLVLHHGGKAETAKDYRGSSELGAGVDVVLSMEKKREGETTILEIRSTKHRWLSDFKLTLKVADGPIFTDITQDLKNSQREENNARYSEVQQIIREMEQTGNTPNQSDVVQRVKDKTGLGRNAILGLLREGEERGFWKSNAERGSKFYRTLFNLSPTQGVGQGKQPEPDLV
ncbi:MAG TPA: AAA family ATPase [Nitrospiria bacterium]|nr:AAA family ATPase [Nitrospiria bacterium]